VLHQLDLPPQSDVVHRLTLSSIERHFYDKQARECHASAQRALSLHDRQQREAKAAAEGATGAVATAAADGRAAGATRPGQAAAAADKALAALSMQGVLRLRQACCHPQLGSFGIRGRRERGGGAAAGLADPMSMRDILGKLIEEEKSRCEEEQRKVLFNLSALGRSPRPTAPAPPPPSLPPSPPNPDPDPNPGPAACMQWSASTPSPRRATLKRSR